MPSMCVTRDRMVAPSRGRGSKLFGGRSPKGVMGRPFAGAWIETLPTLHGHRLAFVAPSRGRGSKPAAGRCRSAAGRVAPSRGRGSKRQSPRRCASGAGVAPSRGRGSKPAQPLCQRGPRGRPFAGAWIETRAGHGWAACRGRRPFAGAWIETPAFGPTSA